MNIYIKIILGTLFMSSISYGETYTDCVPRGPTYIEDNLCKIRVTGCKDSSGNAAIPLGVTATASCNIGICDRKNPPDCQCPTDPNECANDDHSDGNANYSSIEYVSTPRGEPDNEGTAESETTSEGEPDEDSNATVYHSCQKSGDTWVKWSTDARKYFCHMRVSGCMVSDRPSHPNIPPGHHLQANCDTSVCTRSMPPQCQCPTNPNECANDTEGDRRSNYTDRELIAAERSTGYRPSTASPRQGSDRGRGTGN